MITQERLKELVCYNPQTGRFTWLVHRKSTKVGMKAGSVHSGGYWRITLDGVEYLAHRLAILYVDGYFPEHTIDHKDRVRLNNAYSNLREATQQCQTRNRSANRNNSSGVSGVYWDKRKNRWRAEIGHGRARFLGLFKNLLDVAYIRYAAEQCLGFHECNAVSPAKKYIDARGAV